MHVCGFQVSTVSWGPPRPIPSFNMHCLSMAQARQQDLTPCQAYHQQARDPQQRLRHRHMMGTPAQNQSGSKSLTAAAKASPLLFIHRCIRHITLLTTAPGRLPCRLPRQAARHSRARALPRRTHSRAKQLAKRLSGSRGGVQRLLKLRGCRGSRSWQRLDNLNHQRRGRAPAQRLPPGSQNPLLMFRGHIHLRRSRS